MMTVPVPVPSLAQTYAHQYRCTRINMRVYTHSPLYINKCVHIDVRRGASQSSASD
jgi:hypothetical protein